MCAARRCGSVVVHGDGTPTAATRVTARPRRAQEGAPTHGGDAGSDEQQRSAELSTTWPPTHDARAKTLIPIPGGAR